MSAKPGTVKKIQSSKETILKEITLQLSQALPSLKESLGEKKFEKRIKKAAKLLAEGIKPAGSKKAAVAKSTVVKSKEKKTATSLPVKKTVKVASAK